MRSAALTHSNLLLKLHYDISVAGYSDVSCQGRCVLSLLGLSEWLGATP